MEWIETTAPTVESAKDDLLDKLGIDETEAEFEVLDEPKMGLFGKLRQPARVRARIVPLAPRGKDDRRRKPKTRAAAKKGDGQTSHSGSDSSAAPDDEKATGERSSEPSNGGRRRDGRREGGAGARGSSGRGDQDRREPADVSAVADELTRFLAGLVDACDLSAEVTSEVDEEGRLKLSIEGTGLGMLIGPRGSMLSVLHDLCRTRLHCCFPEAEYPKLSIDVGGYRAMRSAALAEHVAKVVADVRETGEPHSLGVMSSGDRKAVHDMIGEVDGVDTVSEGEDPERRIVLVAR